jgi:hypothetical protein
MKEQISKRMCRKGYCVGCRKIPTGRCYATCGDHGESHIKQPSHYTKTSFTLVTNSEYGVSVEIVWRWYLFVLVQVVFFLKWKCNQVVQILINRIKAKCKQNTFNLIQRLLVFRYIYFSLLFFNAFFLHIVIVIINTILCVSCQKALYKHHFMIA